jgi:antitoxin HigA-1
MSRSSTTTDKTTVRIRTHPGEVLQAEYLEPLELSAAALARELGVPGNRISDIVRQRRSMTADTALRLGRYFKTTPEFWMNMQAAHDLSKAAAEHDYSEITARA